VNPVLNDTKWNEIREAMMSVEPLPRWRNRIMHTGYVSPWDREWVHHFKIGGYADVEWVEIAADSPAHGDAILSKLRAIHVPGEATEVGFRILGWVAPGQACDWL
jgi:hypothetical protein